MDEVYRSLAYDGVPLLHVPLCISSTFLVSVAITGDLYETHRSFSSVSLFYCNAETISATFVDPDEAPDL